MQKYNINEEEEKKKSAKMNQTRIGDYKILCIVPDL